MTTETQGARPASGTVSWVWWLLVLVLGACAGFAGMHGLEAERSEQAPNGWDRVGPKIPFRQVHADTAAATRSGAWNLDHYESLWGQASVDRLDVTAVVPEGAVQRILLCSLRKEGLEGPGVVIDRSTSPGTVRGIRLTPRAQTNLKCEGDDLPPPGDEPYTVSLERHAEKGRYVITVGEARTECRGAVPKDGPAVVGGLAATSVLAIVSDGSRQAPHFHPAMVPVGLLLGGLLWAGLCWVERRLGTHPWTTALTSLPLLLSLPLSFPEPERVAESLQLQSLASPWLALAAGVVPALILKGLLQVGRATAGVRGDTPLPRSVEPWAMAVAPILPAAIGLALVPDEGARPVVLGLTVAGTGAAGFALLGVLRRGLGLDGPSRLRATGALLGVFASAVLLSWLGGASQREATVLFGLAATALGGVAVARAAGSAGRTGAVLSAVLVVSALGLLEAGVRHTSVVDRWVGSPEALASQAARQAMASFDALEAGTPSGIPRTGHPVAPPVRSPGTRVVVFGGSAVAGGPHSDALSDYFPAHLEALAAPGVEVLNQGVGDWTTFHIRRHAERQLGTLSPDVVVVYAGRNDQLETLPLTLSELYQHWQVHGTGAAPGPLQDLRLLQGARVLLTTLLEPGLSPAVPVGDAAENLASLTTSTRERGGQVLLVKQGLAPDAGPLAAFHDMLDDLAAAQEGVEVLDAAALLQDAGPGQFVDDRHLTASGTALVARAVHEHLVFLGWLPAAAIEAADE